MFKSAEVNRNILLFLFYLDKYYRVVSYGHHMGNTAYSCNNNYIHMNKKYIN